MDKQFTAKINLKISWIKNFIANKNGGFFPPASRFHSINGEHVALFISVVTSVIALTCLVFGIVNGFWPGNGTAFSFYYLITSPSGIIIFFGYLASINIFYFQLVKVNKKYRILKR